MRDTIYVLITIYPPDKDSYSVDGTKTYFLSVFDCVNVFVSWVIEFSTY